MGMNGNRIDRRGAGKLFAVLWILAAALAMQFVASAQGFSSRLSTQQNAGNVAVPESGQSDTTLSRHIMRAFPVADLRFTADRADGKASPGGPVPFLLPAAIDVAAISYGGIPAMAFSPAVAAGQRYDIIRVRGPPVLGA
ncbi:hypothetical protein ASG68_03230 [Rhizobium sp. Leaf453]|nr:hypothetical protein ASG42_09920 [Rhizobium sp. Leaf391]KQS95910.1 hypothetical protein ASG50_02140 [Rhizobium sp. Leaf386]KQU10016.1 hypothetical protein ASG68_03230 [Rhizobium sp. Leaf453]